MNYWVEMAIEKDGRRVPNWIAVLPTEIEFNKAMNERERMTPDAQVFLKEIEDRIPRWY